MCARKIPLTEPQHLNHSPATTFLQQLPAAMHQLPTRNPTPTRTRTAHRHTPPHTPPCSHLPAPLSHFDGWPRRRRLLRVAYPKGLVLYHALAHAAGHSHAQQVPHLCLHVQEAGWK